MGFYDHNPSAYAKPYTSGYRIGVGVAAVTGLCSAVSTLLLLSYIAYYTLFTRENSPMARGIRAFTKSALGVYLCSLLFSDMLHGVAFSISLKWVSDGGIRHSAACTVQGGIFQVGALGVALWSLAIACHTFSLLFVIKKPPTWSTRIVLGLTWLVLIVPAIVGPQAIQNVEKSGHFYGFIGAWCWIGPGYRLQWYLFYYIWVFLTIFSSTVMYGAPESLCKLTTFQLTHICHLTGFVYLRLFGLLSYENGKLVWKKSGHGRGLNCLSSSSSAHDTTSPSQPSEPGSSASRPHNIADPNRVGKHLKGIARRLMLYPLGK
ncbi:hypothetical protein FRC08_000814 [Ceratobasidium sp. 394]|nr:hypothetical protein FRC08_000814 [Ceratobasidium sp. 394]KAG9090306.1 hypothetical protein FS749_000658 [Ceratobasidium sp. UAMH 11750]